MVDVSPIIKKQKTSLTKLQTSLKKLAAPQENSAKRVSILRKEVPAAEKALKDLRLDPVLLKEIQDELTKARAELTEKETESRQKFGSDLATSLKANNFTLEGNFPKFRVSAYTIEVDFPTKVTIWFGAEIEKLVVTKAVPEEVAGALVKQHNAITGRPFDERQFLRNLKTAYQMYLVRFNRPFGSDVPLPEIHTLCSLITQSEKFRRDPVKENFTEYTRTMFSYDLARLKNRSIDQNELKLSTAALNETQTKGNFFWIPPFEGTPSGTYARLKFTGVA